MARCIWLHLAVQRVQPNGSGTWLDYENNMKWRGGGSCSSMKANVAGSSSSICLPGLLGDNCDEHAVSTHTFSHCKHPLHSSRGAPEVDQRWGLLGCISRAQKAPDQNNHVVSAENSTKMPEMQKNRLIFVGSGCQKNNFGSVSLKKSGPV